MTPKIGYKRVSTLDQKTERQLDGIQFDEEFTDMASGKDTKRPQLQACLRHLRKGDVLYVHSMDRLARNFADLEKILAQLSAKGVAVKFQKEGLTFNGEENPFQTLQLQMLGAFAQFERSLIRERQREGIAIAKAKGKQLGRPQKLTDEQVDELRRRAEAGEEKKSLAAEFGVARGTLYRLIG